MLLAFHGNEEVVFIVSSLVIILFISIIFGFDICHCSSFSENKVRQSYLKLEIDVLNILTSSRLTTDIIHHQLNQQAIE